jgi:large subunit ribosomal protein L25
METIIFDAEPRTAFGTRAARRLRDAGRLPVNLYGHKEGNCPLSLDTKEFTRFLGAGHRILTVRVQGREERSVVKEVQHDALGVEIVHVDLARVGKDERIEVAVAVETMGTPKGVSGGGVLDFPLKEVLVSGPADDIPEHIRVDIGALEIGQAIRIKDLPAPPNCMFMQSQDLVVVHVVAPRLEAPPAVESVGPTEPEVIGRVKEPEEEPKE